MSKQIKLSEIKACVGMEGCSNNVFANALCCMMIDNIDYLRLKAQEYANEGNIEISRVYNNCAKTMQEEKNKLHNTLDSLGHYDDIR